MKGQPCLPWVHVTGIISSLRNDQLFQDGSVVAALNYCRNPARDPQGPFCYVQDTTTNLIRQEYCHPRKCRASGNRMNNVQKDLPQDLDESYLVPPQDLDVSYLVPPQGHELNSITSKTLHNSHIGIICIRKECKVTPHIVTCSSSV